MKNFINLLPLLSCMIMAFILSACKEDNIEQSVDLTIPDDTNQEDPSNSDEPSSNNYVLLSATEKSVNLNITTLELSNPIYEIDKWSGKTVLKSYDKYGESSYYSFIYELPDNVTCYCPSLYDIECTLNSRHLISETKIGRESYIYEYDSRNRPITITSQYGTSAQSKQTVSLTYDNTFNIISKKMTDYKGEILDEISVEYTAIPAKTIPLQCLDVTVGNIFDHFHKWPFTETGLYGNVIPLYLIQRIIYSNGREIEFDYTLDNKGYVIEMIKKVYGASSTSISIWNFEWKSVSTPSYTNWLFSDITSPYYRYLQ